VSRTAIIVAGFSALLVGAFVLRELATGAPATTPVVATRDESAENATPVAPQSEAPSVAPVPRATPEREAAKPTAAPASPLPKLLALAGSGPDYPRDANGKLIAVATMPELSDADFLLHDKVKACLAAHGKPASSGLSGDIFVNFTAARRLAKNGKYATEVDSAELANETTIDRPELTDCIVKTTFAMKLPARDNPVSVWAQRKITLTNGVLEWSWITNYTPTPP
jgi:L-aminopeptidase/D-esterase-like protein